MRVLVLTTAYPTAEAPVAGVFVREHVEAARPYCDEITVVHLERTDVRKLEVERDDEAWRVRYPRRPAAPWHLAAAARGLRLVRAYDIVHAHFFLAGFPAVVLQRRPVVVTEHWSVFLPEDPAQLGPLARAAARLAFGRAAAVLPVSAALQRAIEAHGVHARFSIVPNAIDTSVFFPAPGAARSGNRLLSVGLAYEAKGHDVVIHAVAQMRRAGGDVSLDIVGDGPLLAEHKRLATRLGVDDVVSFHGIEPKLAIAERMRNADLFVLASHYENNPVAVLEALASGLPVVATAVGGVPELLDEHAGILVPPGDPDALADGIRRALAGRDRFDRGRIAARAAERFGAERVGRRLAAIYREVVAQAWR